MNLRALYQFFSYEHFKMDVIYMLRDLLRKRDFMVKVYLKDAHFFSTHMEEPPKTSEVHLERDIVRRVRLPSFRHIKRS